MSLVPSTMTTPFRSINLLRPFPQFDGPFAGLTLLTASASYQSLQVRFQKRPSHYISFEGNYTFSKAIDNSSAGANSFITNSLSSGNPQELDNLSAERSISANDATHRMVLATIVDLPVGPEPLDWAGYESRRRCVRGRLVGLDDSYFSNRNADQPDIWRKPG